MSRFSIGVALGGAAVYFFDPLQGEERRRRVQSLWRENRDTVHNVGAGVSQAADSMRPVVQQLKRGLEQKAWADKAAASWAPALTGLILAGASGGALAYVLDPKNGADRRRRIRRFLVASQSAVMQRIRRVHDAAGTVTAEAKSLVADASIGAEAILARGRG